MEGWERVAIRARWKALAEEIRARPESDWRGKRGQVMHGEEEVDGMMDVLQASDLWGDFAGEVEEWWRGGS